MDSTEVFRPESFDIADLQDEIRADRLCHRLLEVFYLDLVEEERTAPAAASLLAYGANYFLREFVIPDRQQNIFTLPPQAVRKFAGNWYIVRNMEPNLAELSDILRGVDAFYRFCSRTGKVSRDRAEAISRECAELDFYRRRIETFWAIEDDGYHAWERECSLKD